MPNNGNWWKAVSGGGLLKIIIEGKGISATQKRK